jgi:hypothetical protein
MRRPKVAAGTFVPRMPDGRDDDGGVTASHDQEYEQRFFYEIAVSPFLTTNVQTPARPASP